MAREKTRLAPNVPPATLGDLVRTVILWGYFVLVFAAGYWVYFVASMLVSRPRAAGAQRAIHGYFRGFFRLVGAISPQVTFELPAPEELARLRSSVIVANHQSLLDPPLLLSLLPRASTMVRADFFGVPFFGWVLRACGYVRPQGEAAADWLDGVIEQLRGGGNVFLFPEGTRGSGERLGRFRRGAFHVARRFGAPIEVFRIDGTAQVFPPGRRALRLGNSACVSVRRLAHLSAEEVAGAPDTEELMRRVRALLEEAAPGAPPGGGAEPPAR